MVAHVRASAEIGRSAREVYDRWVDTATLPRLLEGVERIERVAPNRFRWRVCRGGRTREWEAEVIENVIGRRIAWGPAAGTPGEAVAVTFDDVAPGRSRITLTMTGMPEEEREIIEERIAGDLARLRDEMAGARPGAGTDAAADEAPVPPRPMAPGGGHVPTRMTAQGAVPDAGTGEPGPDVDEALGAVPDEPPVPHAPMAPGNAVDRGRMTARGAVHDAPRRPPRGYGAPQTDDPEALRAAGVLPPEDAAPERREEA